MSSVTVLHCSSPLVLVKTWKADGTIAQYSTAKNFTCTSRPVGDIRELSTLLTPLAGDPRAAIIRGGLRADVCQGGEVLRNSDTFEDVPRPWLALDIDDFEPQDSDPLTQPGEAVGEFLQTHIPEFVGAAHHWQLTGSAGHTKAAGKLKARVWFWLDEPRTSAQLKAWAKSRWPGGAPFDTSLFSATQLHYTAAPLFEPGVVDPVPVRSGLAEGKMHAVKVPLVEAPAPAPRAPASGEAEMTPYDRKTLAGIYADIEAAPTGDRNNVLHRKAWRAFSIVHAGRAEEGEIRTELGLSATAAGLEAEEIGATLQSAWSASQKAPDDVSPPLDGNDFEADAYESAQEAAQEAKRGKGRLPFGYTLARELTACLKPIAWQVKGFLEADSLGLIYGPPKSGKSFLAIDWACCTATGTPWNGHKVKQGAVFYLAGEGHNGVARRLAAWEGAKGVSLGDAPFAVSNKAAPITDRDAADEVLQAVDDLANETGHHPAVIVVDTLARNFGADENSTEDMSRFIQHLDEIRAKWKCTVLVVHHTGKDQARGARGNSALRGAIDAGYKVDRDELGNVTLEPTDMKDAELPRQISFTLAGVTLPLTDEDGNAVSGAHLVPLDVGYQPPKRGKAGRGRNQRLALSRLADGAWVTTDEWRQACLEDGIDRRRWVDLCGTLEELGEIEIEGPYVRRSGTPPSLPTSGGNNPTETIPPPPPVLPRRSVSKPDRHRQPAETAPGHKPDAKPAKPDAKPAKPADKPANHLNGRFNPPLAGKRGGDPWEGHHLL